MSALEEKWKRGHGFSWFYSKLVILLLLAVVFYILLCKCCGEKGSFLRPSLEKKTES